MPVTVGKVLGRLADGWWAQVHDFEATGEKGHSRGRLIAAASLHQPRASELEAVTVGREVLSRLHELYFGNNEGEPLAALKRAAAQLAAEFAELELVAIALVGEAVYVVVVGKGGVWVKVAGREGWLVNPNRATSPPSALSGWAKAGQVLVAGNSRFWQALGLGAMRAAVANATSGPEVAEGLATVVHGSETGIGGVGVVITTAPRPAPVPTPYASKPQKPIYLSGGDRTVSRRRNLWLGVGFLVALLLLVAGWQWRRAYVARVGSAQNLRIEELVHKFSEAAALVELNPVRSRQLLAEIGPELVKLQSDKAAKKDARIRQIEANFGSVLGVATGVRQVVPTEVLDLGWLRQGMTGSRLGWVEGELVVLDTVAGRLVVVDPNKKSGTVIAGADALGQAKLLASYPGKTIVVGDKGIIQCSVLSDQCSVVAQPDSQWGEVVDIDMFAGNIYLLAATGIWRLQAADTGYGSAQQWLASSEDSSSLSSSSNLAIDGFIWVIKTDGQIIKYTRGARENFAVTDLDRPFTPGSIIYTDSEAEKLYVLDRGNSRIVVLDKTGMYKLQYQLDQAKEASDLVVDEKGGKIYLLAGSKMWEVDL